MYRRANDPHLLKQDKESLQTKEMATERGRTVPSEDCKSLQDSQMDSGFGLDSGSNLMSSSSLYSEELHSKYSTSGSMSKSHIEESQPKSPVSDTLDSGIDLSERISSLNLSSSIETPPPPPPQVENKSRLAQLGLSPVHISILKEIFRKDDDGDTQLHIAVIRGFVEVVWHITRLLPHQALLDLPNNSGRTALHLAVCSGDAALVRHLVVCGASPVARNAVGDTALHVACRSGDADMALALTKQVTVLEVVAARLSYPPAHTHGLLAADLNNYDGQTCIHLAAQHGQAKILQHLTWYGADINAKDGKCGRTALHMAVERRDAWLARFLVESCRASLTITNYSGLTPYQLSVMNGATEVASALGEVGDASLTVAGDASNSDAEEDADEDMGFESSWTTNDLRIGGLSPVVGATAVFVSPQGPFNADPYL